ncbi:hypothetical protein BCR44DRAFT_125596 [Catenaria anguillulae PL171]|uniref:NADH:ubiquinone oxidoreductase intermediate-associated protein 30 domain-containing protein n=1 Tax=Catenaria anguillulae PL171 TaxID=765915 RepID=A0A1Y2HU07_9FUNG|nr:hypothetical protein BCR44DRAFT_125596 [Catenaria anguillulae PL171]
MAPTEVPRRLPLYSFATPESLQSLLVGTDKDMGGLSEATLELNKDPETPAAVFRGTLSTTVPDDCKYIASGYAGIKTRRLPRTLFGQTYHKLDQYSYLELVARDLSPELSVSAPSAGGDAAAAAQPSEAGKEFEEPPSQQALDQEVAAADAAKQQDASRGGGKQRRQFFLNIKATTYAELDLYQYPLRFENNDWHTFQIPFRHFILTHKGFVLDNQRDLPLDSVESFSISIVRQDGPFHLEIASLAATNPPGLSDVELSGEMLMAAQSGDQEKVEKIKNHLRKVDLF